MHNFYYFFPIHNRQCNVQFGQINCDLPKTDTMKFPVICNCSCLLCINQTLIPIPVGVKVLLQISYTELYFVVGLIKACINKKVCCTQNPCGCNMDFINSLLLFFAFLHSSRISVILSENRVNVDSVTLLTSLSLHYDT